MPAPTALRREEDAPPVDMPLAEPEIAGDEDILLDPSAAFPEEAMAVDAEPEESEDVIDEEGRPKFAPAQDIVRYPTHTRHKSRITSDKLPQSAAARIQNRQVRIPPHRMTPLKSQWPRIYPPLVEHLKLQVRMNVKRKAVELRTSRHTTDPESIQRGVDFLTAFVCGFDVDDAIALLRLDDLYIGMLACRGSGREGVLTRLGRNVRGQGCQDSTYVSLGSA